LPPIVQLRVNPSESIETRLASEKGVPFPENLVPEVIESVTWNLSSSEVD
jgi:hypothetical protein